MSSCGIGDNFDCLTRAKFVVGHDEVVDESDEEMEKEEKRILYS